ncbi:MAG: PQQ-binding-like beta-propeller repeat protein [Anaerolineales bacterium]|nr:PQQ-binding-like beta-propeller repeat protein [Anaerolineales bacterium]
MEINTLQRKNQIESDATPRVKRNWPLIVGLFIVLTISILAIIGPTIAPKDPSEEHNISMIEGTWYIPPFDIGTPGYPLGSDRFGRDLFSRLLWGIRPTMVMVFIVAIVRLFLGVIIGLSAGWFSGKTGRFLNSLIQVALALPVLLVALGAIAIVGVELGIWAFIIGLSLTGWVDTALQVREQTRIVKKQVYIEAANAMGATNQQILSNHILKQITPMLLMLFAFEVSSTLMLTAGLGFLGYYIGGDVWVETDDFVARRISGSPELGQMLSTSWLSLTKPGAMVVIGTTVFLTVLGFNLIGEGLRQNMGFAKVQRKNIFSEVRNGFGFWLENFIWHPLLQFFRIKPLRLGLSIIGIFFVLSLGSLYLLDVASNTNAAIVSVLFNRSETNPVDDQMSETQEQASTNSSETMVSIVTTSYDPVISWEFVDEGGYTGGPALSNDQSHFFIASSSGNAYALDLDGQILWQIELLSGGVGSPAVSQDGDIYFSNDTGGLSKFSPLGELIWNFQSNAGERSHSGPAIGPNGNIFYTVGNASKGFVQAVSPDGEDLWATEAKTRLFFEIPIPSSDGKYVFLKDDIFSQEKGEYIDLDYELEVIRYFSGENGQNYLVAGQKIIQWEQADSSIQMIDIYEWDSSNISNVITAGNVGVDETGTSWQLYTTPGGSSQTVWVSEEDQALGTNEVRFSSGYVVEMKDDLSALVCGGGSFNPISTDCALISPDSEDPLWRFHLGNYGPVAGGLFINDMYYVATEEGYVFEIDDAYEEISSSTEIAGTSSPIKSEADIGIQWSYQASDQISSISQSELDGNLFLTSEDDNLHILKPDGEVFNVIHLPTPPFHQINDTGRGPSLFIEPAILPDETIIIVSNENTVYAMNIDGDIIWETELEAAPSNYPFQDESGNLYIIDNNAALNVFDKDGMKWRFQSEAADIPANGFAVDDAGNIYYVVTNYSKGYIQAVSSEGQNRWVVEAKTRDFYDELQLSSDGKYLSLAEILVSTEAAEIVVDGNIAAADEFIFAKNGQYFVRTLHTVNKWQPGPAGIELLSTGIVSEEDTTLRPPLGSSADSNGIIWLYYPELYIGGGIIVVWMSPDGELLGNHLYDRNFQTIIGVDMDSSTLTECVWFEESKSIDCNTYSPLSEDPVWSITLSDIPSFHGGFIEGNIMYIFGEDNEIYLAYLGEPATP